MAKERSSDRDPVTIVGGRPMHRAVDVSQLPTGIEQALTLAALDCTFRERLIQDPVAATAAKGILLQPSEQALLSSTPAATLRSMAEQTVVPRAMSRRQFVKPVAASIVALITGNAMMLCSGCTGADSWDNSDADTQQLWMQLAGHTCFVYLCPTSLQSKKTAVPVMLALHDQGETCLSNVQRWRAAADKFGFNLVSVNWTEEPATAEAKDKLAAELRAILEEFGGTYALSASSRFLSSRGEATPIAWKAGFERDPGYWKSAVFLGGMPPGDWQGAPELALQNLIAPPPALFHVMGTTDTQLTDAMAMATALKARSATVHVEQVAGSTAQAVLDFSAIYTWLQSPA